MANDKIKKRAEQYKYMKRDTKENIEYWLMMAVPLLFSFVFRYCTSYAQVTAFQDWFPGAPFFGDKVRWVGLKWFKIVLEDPYIWRGVKNTLRLWFVGLPFSFAPIMFAIVVSELKSKKLGHFTRIMCYLPSFMSAIVVTAIFSALLGSNGMVTRTIRFLGVDCASLLTNKNVFPWSYAFINAWETFAWGSLLQQATIAGIDPGLYDSAKIDGASNMQRVRYVVWPHLRGIYCYGLIMGISGIMGSDVTQIIRMYNPAVYETADTIGSYIFRTSMEYGRYSYSSAAAFIQSLLNFVLLYVCNKLCQKFADYSLW